jgi:phenylacetate-coenzyme A ligase PaaK-like adenylate-forming protein
MNKQQRQPTMAEFQQKLMQTDDSFLARMEEEARRRGISEAEIQQGKQYLGLIRSGRAV